MEQADQRLINQSRRAVSKFFISRCESQCVSAFCVRPCIHAMRGQARRSSPHDMSCIVVTATWWTMVRAACSLLDGSVNVQRHLQCARVWPVAVPICVARARVYIAVSSKLVVMCHAARVSTMCQPP